MIYKIYNFFIYNMSQNKLTFKEFEKVLINTINNNYINNPCNNDLSLYTEASCVTITDYIQIYKLIIKMKDKVKLKKLEIQIEDLKNQNNKMCILCGIILIILIIKLFI